MDTETILVISDSDEEVKQEKRTSQRRKKPVVSNTKNLQENFKNAGFFVKLFMPFHFF